MNIENNLPVFKENVTVINVTLGETFTLTLKAEDPDGDEITFDVPNIPPGASFTTNGNTLNFVWNVDSPEPANLTFLVQDTKNASTTLSPTIQLCRCLNGSGCFIPEASSEQTAAIKNTFIVMSCNCPLGYTGEFCETVKDFCRGHLTPPCHPLVTCANSPTGFTCGTCPNGYEGDGTFCVDKNECGGNQTVCDQTCTNTAGSYFCGCRDGYSLDLNDGKTCNDIDECSKANDCSQLCNNTIGSYNCYCRIGFLVDPNNTKACTAKTKCDSNNPCRQICYVDPLQAGQEKCDCNLGYRLAADSINCDDVNECENTQDNLCDQTCANNIGSYTCSCLQGYKSTGPTTCVDINECLDDQSSVCNGVGQECENIPGSFRCACAKRLNMVRVNGTCIYREDDKIVADLAPAPPSARQDQIDNAIQVTLVNYQKSNYTLDADFLFKDSVVKLLNDFCNENSLRPQDCGVEQNQLFFNEKLVKRLPGYPEDSGSNTTIKFYVDYPSTIFINKTLDKTILASIVFAELSKFEKLIGIDITLDTSVLPEAPGNPTTVQRNNSVELKILNFPPNQWTIFYDTVFRRSIALALNKYCDTDNYTRTQDCGLTGSESFNSSHIKRLVGSPSQSGGDALVSFYVDHPGNLDPVLQTVLASMLVTRKTDLEIALSQNVEIQTSAKPADPPSATSEQTTNSVVIRINSFDASQWTLLNDRRLRRSIAKRIAKYCSDNMVECQVHSGGSTSFSESDVQRSSSGTPSDAGGNSIDYSFYVKYPGGSNPITKSILASIVFLEIEAMQSESSFFFSLQTPLELPAPTAPNTDQLNNTIEMSILNQQANEWHVLADNNLRAAIAAQVGSYCAGNLVVCGVSSDQVSFELSNVTRLANSPVQDGNNIRYTLFVDYPSNNKPMQRNLLAGILTDRLQQLKNATNLDISIQTSTLAPKPAPTATANQISNAVNVSAANIQADKWTAIQDMKFRGYVAQAIAEYCQASASRIQECALPGGNGLFTSSHVKFVNPGSPKQNGTDAEIEFFVEYPGGGTMSQAILLLIMNEKLVSSVQPNTGLQLTLLTTIEVVTERPPTVDNTENAIQVVLKDFQADQWSFRDELFRENMAKAIKNFCAKGTYHRAICNMIEAVSNAFTADNIHRIPGSPKQSGANSILEFYATLPPSDSSSLAKSILATIFTSEQDVILSVDSDPVTPEDSIPSSETPALTTVQRNNLVQVTIFNFRRVMYTTLEVVDIRVTVTARMNSFCFSPAGDVCGLTAGASRRKKRAAGQMFSENDVIVDATVTESGNNTVVGVVVNKPGTSTPVEDDVVKDALHQTLQEDGRSDISNLNLGVFDTPTVSETQQSNAVNVTLTNTNASQWTLQQDISFRKNMSQAIIQFCNESDERLALCNLTREQVAQIDVQNVQILPNSPTQDGNNAVLSFFVDLPGGTTMPPELVATIYSVSPNVISQPTTVVSTSQNTALTKSQTENLVHLKAEGASQHPTDAIRLDVQISIASRLNEYCRNNSEDKICPNTRNFTKDDVLVQIDNTTGAISFVVKNPDSPEGAPVSSRDVQDAINGEFTSDILRLKMAIPSAPTETDSEVDWPLILGLTVGGVLLFIFVILTIILGVANNNSGTSKFKSYEFDTPRDSIYSARGWSFDRDSPYQGSPFSSIDAIPGFDEDGLPSDARPADTRV